MGNIGHEYKVWLEASNSLGSKMSEMVSVRPAIQAPNKPHIRHINPFTMDNITIDIQCEGYYRPQISAWFEIELEPPPIKPLPKFFHLPIQIPPGHLKNHTQYLITVNARNTLGIAHGMCI